MYAPLSRGSFAESVERSPSAVHGGIRCKALFTVWRIDVIKIEQLWTEVDGVKEVQLIARDEGSALPFVGTIGLLLGAKSSGIRRLFVAPSERRRGIGTTLVNLCCRKAKDHGSETLGLSLGAGNEEAMEFYKRLGFIRAYQYEDGSHVVCKVL